MKIIVIIALVLTLEVLFAIEQSDDLESLSQPPDDAKFNSKFQNRLKHNWLRALISNDKLKNTMQAEEVFNSSITVCYIYFLYIIHF